MFVIATAGHVDHGKSTLMRALTGMETDRWEEEKRRGLTLDLGFAWTTLDSGKEVAFVDVPGHERYLTNMLAGIAPATVVLFVVAADQGWQAQSTEHFQAITALGIEQGVIALTRTDLAQQPLETVVATIREQMVGTPWEQTPIVPVSAISGEGISQLRHQLDEALDHAYAPDPTGRLRLWIDRSFTIKGAGTVITGTLTDGSLAKGNKLSLHTGQKEIPVEVRGVQSRNVAVDQANGTNRVAVNLRGITAEEVGRGHALIQANCWSSTEQLDVRRVSGHRLDELPDETTVHIGTAAVPAHLRPFDDHHGRLSLAYPLPLRVGDRLIIRIPGSELGLTGVEILDVTPPALELRGAGRARAQTLSTVPSGGDAYAEVREQGAITLEELRLQGYVNVPTNAADKTVAPGYTVAGEWLIHDDVIVAWVSRLKHLLDDWAATNPLEPGMNPNQLAQALQHPSRTSDWKKLPHPALLEVVLEKLIRDRHAIREGSLIISTAAQRGLGLAENAVAHLETRLAAEPFVAPTAEELQQLGLGVKELAAAEKQGRLLRLPDNVVLLPKAPAQAMAVLARLEQPFTTSAARQALDTTRRVAIPLLEHLDGRGWTKQLQPGQRVIVR